MQHDGNSRLALFEQVEDYWDRQRESAQGPHQMSVLNEHPLVSPVPTLTPQCLECTCPRIIPAQPDDAKIEPLIAECFRQALTIILYTRCGFVAPADEGDYLAHLCQFCRFTMYSLMGDISMAQWSEDF
jgi:hypothetical protein